MSQNKKLRVAMQLVLAVSATGAATILHNAPAGAVENYTTGSGAYVPSDNIASGTAGVVGTTSGKNIIGQARAQILAQITSASVQTLDFGKVVPTAAAGTIVIAANGDISNTDGARYVPNSGAQKATLSFSGDQNQNIQIEAASTVTIKHASDASQTMLVDLQYTDEAANTAPGGTTIFNTKLTSGSYSLNYGGTLTVGAGQAAGIYTGTYDIFVTYIV